MLKDPLKELLGYRLRRVSSAMLSELSEKLVHLDLRPAEASVLVLIAANPKISQSDACRMLGMQSANMAPLAKKLQERGFIERKPLDGRSHGLTLTMEGHDLTRQVQSILDAQEAALLAKIPEEIRDAFTKGLDALWPENA